MKTYCLFIEIRQANQTVLLINSAIHRGHVLLTRDRKDELFRFLEGFSNQTYPTLRIIVIYSNSSDGTREDSLKQLPQITLITVTDQEYWVRAINACVKLALKNGYDFLTINDDSVVEPDYLERMVAIATKHQVLISGSQEFGSLLRLYNYLGKKLKSLIFAFTHLTVP